MVFADRGPELTQKQIADALGLPLPTVHRLTTVLAERGFLEREPATRRLRLGLEVTRLIGPFLDGMRLPELARGHLLSLAAETGETVNLAILSGREVVYLLSESGGRLLTPHSTVGMRLSAHCISLGKCLLAHLPPDAARAALGPEPYERRTPRTLTSWRELAASLDEVRGAGVAISEEEYEEGLVSIAVPVAWTAGPGSAAINISLPTTRAGEDFRLELIERLRATAAAIDRAAGFGRSGVERSRDGR
jgi:IclR family transcriptional regulator, acetate operon repressor